MPILVTNLSAKLKETMEFTECCAKINGGWLSTKTAREKELERGGGGCHVRKMTQNEVINLSLPTKEQPVRSQIEMHR